MLCSILSTSSVSSHVSEIKFSVLIYIHVYNNFGTYDWHYWILDKINRHFTFIYLPMDQACIRSWPLHICYFQDKIKYQKQTKPIRTEEINWIFSYGNYF